MHYKDELTELVKEALKEGIPALVKEYGDEDITVISIDADNTTGFGDDYSFTLFVNTQENQDRRVKDDDGDADPWYYRFCEYEMYTIPDPDCFEKTLSFLNEGYASGMAMNEVYEEMEHFLDRGIFVRLEPVTVAIESIYRKLPQDLQQELSENFYQLFSLTDFEDSE